MNHYTDNYMQDLFINYYCENNKDIINRLMSSDEETKKAAHKELINTEAPDLNKITAWLYKKINTSATYKKLVYEWFNYYKDKVSTFNGLYDVDFMSVGLDNILKTLKDLEFDINFKTKASFSRFVTVAKCSEFMNSDYVNIKRFSSIGWLIEKYVLGDSFILQLEGKYALGLKHPLKDDELTYTKLSCELNLEGYTGDVYQSITRTNEGMRTLLRKYFPCLKNSKNKEAEIKMCYFFFKAAKITKEEKEGKNINIQSFLDNNTLENMDLSAANMKTKNGYLMRKIKNYVSRELNLSFMKQVNNAITDVAEVWSQWIKRLLLTFYSKSDITNLKHIKNQIQGLLDVNITLPAEDFNSNPYEQIYINLSTNEYLGYLKDLKDVEYTTSYDDKNMPIINDIYKELDAIFIDSKNADRYISDNKNMFLTWVFNKKHITNNDKRKLKNAKKHLLPFLRNFNNHTNASNEIKMPVLFLVVYFQEYIFSDKNESIENNFYRYTFCDCPKFKL